MKYYDLDEEELEILTAYNSGELKQSENAEEDIAMLKQAARNTLVKEKNVNFRLSYRDLLRLKTKAIEEGIPYQTLLSSLVHKYVS